MHILVKCGFANRLRTIVGFWYISDMYGENCLVDWKLGDPACNGAWKDVFQLSSPSETMEVIDVHVPSKKDYFFVGHYTIARTLHRFGNQYLPIELQNVSINDIYESSFHREIEDVYYSKLRFRHDILEIVSEFVDKTFCGKEFVAVHIRRTDHSVLAKSTNKYTEDEEFENFMTDSWNQGYDIYLATDDVHVQRKYGSKCVTYQTIDESNHGTLRQTSLQHAVIDALIAAHAVKFMGSGFSSYSKLIEILNRNISKIMSL